MPFHLHFHSFFETLLSHLVLVPVVVVVVVLIVLIVLIVFIAFIAFIAVVVVVAITIIMVAVGSGVVLLFKKHDFGMA